MLNRTILLAALMTLSLGGCADINRMFSPPQPPSEKIDIGSSTDGQNWIDSKGNPMPPPTAQIDTGYNRLAGEITGESVQMYSLDAPGQPVSKVNRQTAGTGSYGLKGVPSSTDNSVTVFPFSNDMYTPGIKPGVSGYGRRKPMTADKGNGTMLPMPDGMGELPSTTDMSENGLKVYRANGSPVTIYFEHGSAALNGAARQTIAQIARNYGGAIQIDGHASHRTGVKDPVKAGLINFQMSMKRAMVVMKKLMMDGVPASVIKLTAHGDAEPAIPEIDRKAEKKNRRVEIRTGQK
jgi:outer membrane protein OmpA-like peptidoglycan-associated protein